MQEAIDEGTQWCDTCERFGFGVFCGQCARRFQGHGATWRECKPCARVVTTDYCPFCGRHLATAWLKRLERGEVDFRQEIDEAVEMVKRIFHRRPDIAADVGGAPARKRQATTREMVDALNAGWGKS